MTLKLESLKDYEELAKKIIGSRFPVLINDDEAIGEVVKGLAEAEQKYDPEKGKMPKNQWIVWYARFAAMNYYNNVHKKRKNEPLVTLDDSAPSKSLMGNLSYESNQENVAAAKEILEWIKDSGIPKIEVECFFRVTIHGETVRDIGKDLNISRQTVCNYNRKIKEILQERFSDSLS